MFTSASAGPIFASGALTAALIASILSTGLYFAILRQERLRISEPRHVIVFFLIWMAAFTFEFYFLGPYSFVELTSEGNLNVTVNYYLSHGYDGGRFSHQYAGGQDVYSLLFGKHFFNPDRFLIQIFPLWIAIFLHKFFIGALGFIGGYFLARHVAPGNRAIAVATASLFTVSHFYLLNWSTNWSPGFSVFPLVVYLCVARSREPRYWLGVFLVALVLSPADPIHIFPALAVAVIGSVILLGAANLKRVTLSFIFLTACSLANWHEVLYAYWQNVSLSTRLLDSVMGIPKPSFGFFESVWQGLGIGLRTMWMTWFIFLICLVALMMRRDPFLIRSGLAFVWMIGVYAFAQSFSWQLVGLGFLNQLSHHYMILSFTVIASIVIARTLATPDAPMETKSAWLRRLRPEIGVLAIAMAALTWNKGLNIGLLVWFGGQSNLFAYSPIDKSDWNPREDFRVVSMFEMPNANIVAGIYGIDVFDGQLNINNTSWSDYWESIVHRDPTHALTTRAGAKWQYWNGRTYDVEDHLRLDLLGIANVRFLLSGLPLEGGALKPVVVPTPEEQAKRHPEYFKSQVNFLKFRLQRIFDPGKLYIYELPRFLPRVFAASSVEVEDANVGSAARHDRIAEVAFDRTIVVSENHIKHLRDLGTIKSLRHQKVTDGFDVTLDAPDGGIVVINNFYVPFWEAAAGNGRKLEVVPANAVQMAIAVLPGTETVRVRYRRPLLKEKIVGLIH